jgi:hypothetical protein
VADIRAGQALGEHSRLGAIANDPEAKRTSFLRPGSRSEYGAGIEFDVAVTTKKAGAGKAGAKLKLSVVEAEIGGGGSAAKENVSRIKFTINVGQWVG